MMMVVIQLLHLTFRDKIHVTFLTHTHTGRGVAINICGRLYEKIDAVYQLFHTVSSLAKRVRPVCMVSNIIRRGTTKGNICKKIEALVLKKL